jgi:nucleoside-diphosphate-sugar epimerase
VECVVHLAARAHVQWEYERDPLTRFRSANVTATARLAAEAARAGVKRLVFLSSIGVNGQQTFDAPFRETDPPQPATPYAISKWEAEKAIISVATAHGMDYVILRAPLVYGAQAPGNFGRLVAWVARGRPLPVGSVTNKRSMIYVENLADGLLFCLRQDQAANQLFLIADDYALSTADLIRRIGDTLGIPVRLWRFPESLLRASCRISAGRFPPASLLYSLEIDSSCIRRRIGWSPIVGIDDALRRTLVPCTLSCDGCSN